MASRPERKLIYCSRTVPEIEKALAELKRLMEYRLAFFPFPKYVDVAHCCQPYQQTRCAWNRRSRFPWDRFNQSEKSLRASEREYPSSDCPYSS